MSTNSPVANLPYSAILISLVEIAVGIIVITILFRILRFYLFRYIQDTDKRFRTRKIINSAKYIVILVFIASVFSNSVGQLTVVFGAVGAGVAFALQEVITSLAGWIAISFGQFYSIGDRIKLAGIVGDVIDVSPLRTTLMECGDWVQGDLYNGRLVRLANSNVFQAPVYNYSNLSH